MEALRFTGSTKILEYVQVPVPVISQPDQVLIKVAFAGVCGTDIHIIAVSSSIFSNRWLVQNTSQNVEGKKKCIVSNQAQAGSWKFVQL